MRETLESSKKSYFIIIIFILKFLGAAEIKYFELWTAMLGPRHRPFSCCKCRVPPHLCRASSPSWSLLAASCRQMPMPMEFKSTQKAQTARAARRRRMRLMNTRPLKRWKLSSLWGRGPAHLAQIYIYINKSPDICIHNDLLVYRIINICVYIYTCVYIYIYIYMFIYSYIYM